MSRSDSLRSAAAAKRPLGQASPVWDHVGRHWDWKRDDLCVDHLTPTLGYVWLGKVLLINLRQGLALADASVTLPDVAMYEAGQGLHAAPPRDRFGVYLQLRIVTRMIEEALDGALREHGLSIAEFCALRLLVGDGPQSLSLLGRWVSISNSGTTKLVDRLEARGLVSRERASDDRRVVYVRPTSAGEELVRNVFPEHLDNIFSLLGCLDESDIDHMYGLLTALRAGIDGEAAMNGVQPDCPPMVRPASRSRRLSNEPGRGS